MRETAPVNTVSADTRHKIILVRNSYCYKKFSLITWISVYTIGRCVVLTCSDYFKSTGVLTLQATAAVSKVVKKREKRRKNALYRGGQRDVHALFKRKTKKKSLTLKKVDIKDSFRNMFSEMNLNGDRRKASVARASNMKFVDRSRIVRDRTTGNASAAAVNRNWKDGGTTTTNAGENNTHASFSIINVNDIIRDTATDSLLKF